MMSSFLLFYRWEWLSLRDVKWLIQGHTAGQRWSWDRRPGLISPAARLGFHLSTLASLWEGHLWPSMDPAILSLEEVTLPTLQNGTSCLKQANLPQSVDSPIPRAPPFSSRMPSLSNLITLLTLRDVFISVSSFRHLLIEILAGGSCQLVRRVVTAQHT